MGTCEEKRPPAVDGYLVSLRKKRINGRLCEFSAINKHRSVGSIVRNLEIIKEAGFDIVRSVRDELVACTGGVFYAETAASDSVPAGEGEP